MGEDDHLEVCVAEGDHLKVGVVEDDHVEDDDRDVHVVESCGQLVAEVDGRKMGALSTSKET